MYICEEEDDDDEEEKEDMFLQALIFETHLHLTPQ